MIGEVKNVKSLSYTSQLRDYVAYAKAHGYEFSLFIRSGDATKLSGPLQQAIRDGDIVLFKVLPG